MGTPIICAPQTTTDVGTPTPTPTPWPVPPSTPPPLPELPPAPSAPAVPTVDSKPDAFGRLWSTCEWCSCATSETRVVEGQR